MSYLLRTWICLCLFIGGGTFLLGQNYSRSGHPAAREAKPSLKRVPCEGDAIFTEDFDQKTALPNGFQVLDQDGQTPRSSIQFLTPQGGWQVVSDFKDSTNGNQAVASPSWYQSDGVPSDDWLILPQLEDLPDNTCFSFLAYSQDSLFPESYEVRVSTTGDAPADFLANDPLLTVDAQPTDFSYQSMDLSAYAGQDIYLAIRHTSLDRFILVLDDLRLATVPQRDLAILSVDTTGFLAFDFPGDTIRVRGTLVNRGQDTLSFDSAELTVGYRLNLTGYHRDLVDTAFTLLPNETFSFEHYRPLVTPGFGRFFIEVIFNAIAGDDRPSNDTLVVKFEVGTVLSVQVSPEGAWQVGPNPADAEVTVRWPAALRGRGRLELLDLQGRSVLPTQPVLAGVQQQTVDLAAVPAGLYILHFTPSEGQPLFTRLRVE